MMRHASSGEQPRVLAIRVPGDHCHVPAADADRDDPQGGPAGAGLPCQPDRSPDGCRLAGGDDPGVRAEKGSWPASALAEHALTTLLPAMTCAERPPRHGATRTRGHPFRDRAAEDSEFD